MTRGAGVLDDTRSPALAMMGTSCPTGPGTVPPMCIVGIRGTEIEAPPIPGIHEGTVQCKRPTVRFHMLAAELNANRNAPTIAFLIPVNTDFIPLPIAVILRHSHIPASAIMPNAAL